MVLGSEKLPHTRFDMRADDFAGPVSLEWERMWHPYLPSLDEALTAATASQWW
jgi:hypothetical protein